MKCLNLGCGTRFHPEWTNIDTSSTSPYVQAHDCRRGIPFPTNSFDVVYHSHILEHFPKDTAPKFMRECYRVMKPGGIIRVAVPDLEQIARLYLQALEKALAGDDIWKDNYDWLMLEFFDQVVRDHSGGAMLDYLKQDRIPNECFIYERVGGEARRIIQALQAPMIAKERQTYEVGQFVRRIRFFPQRIRERLVRRLLGPNSYMALQIGRFRLSGEIHQWMYDRYSLAQLLHRAGFVGPHLVGPAESQIPNWREYHLDTELDGTTYKPDSLYMEATKPREPRP
jgi:SAM-dependent methyltransferase